MEVKNTFKFTLSSLVLGAGVASAFAGQTPPLSADLHEIANLKSFKSKLNLKPDHLAALRRTGFFTSPSNSTALYVIYGENDYENLPSFVTTDNVLEIYHSFYDSILRRIEDQKLTSGTRKLSAAMLASAEKRLQTSKGTDAYPATLRNVAFFGVADRLIGDKATIPPEAMPLVTKTLALIKSHAGFAANPIFGYETDFSQFTVRGHYTRKPSLGRYFQAMMWYGLVPFALPKSGEPSTALIQSLFVSHDLINSPELARWRRMYDITSLFAGTSNHLTPIEWEATSNKVFGPHPSSADFTNPQNLSKFVEAIQKARPPVFTSGRTTGNNPDSVQLRFFGQRSIPDSYILQTLSCDDRIFPSPLDVMSVLGSDSATRILDANPSQYNGSGWSDYKPKRDSLTSEFAAYPKATWSSNLYWSWLDSLRTMIAKPQPNYPSFMKTEAWADKSLYSSLASWTELRHDTILYGEESGAEMGDERPENKLKGYVEPNLAFYRRLIAMVTQTQSELGKRGYLEDEVKSQLTSFIDLLNFFESVTQKELKGQSLSLAENDRIRYVEGRLEALHNEIMKFANGYQTLTQDDLDNALVADVHTGGDQALQVAVGRADSLFAVVPIEGKLWLTRGSTLSYFEFKRPISKRMTDKVWKAQLNAGQAPDRPTWIKSFFVPIEVKDKRG